jgi:hypothetical protein
MPLLDDRALFVHPHAIAAAAGEPRSKREMPVEREASAYGSRRALGELMSIERELAGLTETAR